MSLRSTRTSCSAPAGCTWTTRSAAWQEFSAKLHEVAGAAARTCASCGWWPRTPTSRWASPAATGSTATATKTSPTARCSPARSRTASTATCASRFPAVFGGREVDGRAAAVRGRQSGRLRGRRGRGLLREMLDDRRRRVGAGRVRDRHQLQRRPVHQAHPVRREDRRHVSTWPSAPATPRPATQPNRRCTGTWSATCATAARSRRRRADLLRRQVRAGVLARPDAAGRVALRARASQAIRATRSMKGRSWTRSTRTPAAAATATTAAVPSRFDSGSPSGSAVTSLCEQASSSG